MKALAYRIMRESNNDVLIEGIVENVYSKIYPAQTDHYLTYDYPDLPSEVELRHFNAKGLILETKEFDISWQELEELTKNQLGIQGFSGLSDIMLNIRTRYDKMFNLSKKAIP